MEGLWVELVFMMIVLKIPVVYLCAVVWWAIRAEPRPVEGAAVTASLPDPAAGLDPDRHLCPWYRRRPRGGSPRPAGGRRAAGRRPRPSSRVAA